MDNIGPNEISPRQLRTLSRLKPETLPLVNSVPRYGVPYVGIGKFVAIGLNYSDHAKEAGPAHPLRADRVHEGHHLHQRAERRRDPAQELHQARLGSRARRGHRHQAKYVSEAEALNHVAGYCIVNDVSERSFQMATTQWDKGKGFDTAGPIGPWLVTTDEIPTRRTSTCGSTSTASACRPANAHHDLQRGEDHLACEPVHDAASRRHHRHRHPPGVGLGMKPRRCSSSRATS